MPAATNVQAKKKAGSTVREHLPGLAITRAIMQLIQASSNLKAWLDVYGIDLGELFSVEVPA